MDVARTPQVGRDPPAPDRTLPRVRGDGGVCPTRAGCRGVHVNLWPLCTRGLGVAGRERRPHLGPSPAWPALSPRGGGRDDEGARGARVGDEQRRDEGSDDRCPPGDRSSPSGRRGRVGGSEMVMRNSDVVRSEDGRRRGPRCGVIQRYPPLSSVIHRYPALSALGGLAASLPRRTVRVRAKRVCGRRR